VFNKTIGLLTKNIEKKEDAFFDPAISMVSEPSAFFDPAIQIKY